MYQVCFFCYRYIVKAYNFVVFPSSYGPVDVRFSCQVRNPPTMKFWISPTWCEEGSLKKNLSNMNTWWSTYSRTWTCRGLIHVDSLWFIVRPFLICTYQIWFSYGMWLPCCCGLLSSGHQVFMLDKFYCASFRWYSWTSDQIWRFLLKIS